MIHTNIKFDFIPKDNKQWRIAWLGDVRYHNFAVRRSMPSIAVVLSGWCRSANSAHAESITNGQNHQIYVPIGYLGKLRIGDVWQSGQLVDKPQYSLESFSDVIINRNTTSIIKAGLSSRIGDQDVFFLPLAHHPHHASHTHSYCLKVKLPENKRLIIPAIELIRFYFGSSSGLLARLFQFPLTPNTLWVDAMRETGRKRSGIVLAEGIPGWSAADVARIAFDPIAWHAAQLVGNSLSAARISGQPLYPKAHFPFNGRTTLQASGIWLPFGNDPVGTFLVYRLVSCSRRFPFRGLEYQMAGKKAYRLNTAVGNMEISAASPGDNRKTLRFAAKPVGKNYVEKDPSKSLATVEVVTEETVQFPDLKFKSVRRIEEGRKQRLEISMTAGKPVDASSVGSGGKDDNVRPVDLVRRSRMGLPETDAIQLMNDLVEVLSTSGRFDHVELLKLLPEEGESLLPTFRETISNHSRGAWKRGLRKRMPEFSNLQTASVAKGNVVAFLLIAGMNQAPWLSPLCIAVKPDFSKMGNGPTVKNVVDALRLTKSPHGEDMANDEVQPHFMAISPNSLNRDYLRLVAKLGTRVILYCGIFP